MDIARKIAVFHLHMEFRVVHCDSAEIDSVTI